MARLASATGDPAVVGDRPLDDGRAADLPVKDDRQLTPDILAGRFPELPTAFLIE